VGPQPSSKTWAIDLSRQKNWRQGTKGMHS
jgi:hypothetical protein